MATWADYSSLHPDVALYISDASKPGIDTGTAYTQKYGVNTSGWEQDWLNRANAAFGSSATDAGAFSPEALGALHYANWARNAGYTPLETKYDYAFDPTFQGMSAEDKAVIRKQQFQNQYGGMGSAAKQDFQNLLNKLEGSKIRQQGAKDISARPGIYAEGLANIMRNF